MNTNLKLTSAIALLSLSMSAQANIVDLFEDPAGANAQVVTDNIVGGGGDFEEYPGGMIPSTTILGGYRDLYAELNSLTPGTISGETQMVVESNGPGTGQLKFSNTSGAIGTGIVQWDGNDNSINLNTASDLHIDLINQAGCPVTGCSFFEFAVFESDLNWTFDFGVYTSAGDYTVFTLPASSIDPADNFVRRIDFSSFTIPDDCNVAGPSDPTIIHKECVGSVDMSDVAAIELRFNELSGTSSIDFRIGSVTKNGNVPEPSILGLMGIALAGVGFTRRKKIKA